MKKIMLLAGLALVLAGSIVYANQDSAAETAVKDCGSCCPVPSCPTDGSDCCTK